MHSTDSCSLRRGVYALLITVAAGAVAGRILAVTTMGDNDRSRWDTVRALVDDGTYVIGHRDIDPASREYVDRGIITEDGWKTIDKVLHPETHAFYSSKPPLLPTLLAGEYWLLKHTLGWSITENREEVVRTILLTVNGLLFVFYLIFLARLVEQFGATDWGRLYVLASACFATFLTTFAVTLNNHSVAACSALFALYPVLQIWYAGERGMGLFLTAGLFAGFTAVNELPAASFAATLLLLLLFRAPGRTLLLSVPAAALPVAAALWTNYLALGQLRPAYGEFGGPWYEFEGSHWKIDPGQVKQGIDWAYQTESRAMYAFHVLIGHHGIFSLSPIFLLAAAGMIYGLVANKGSGPPPCSQGASGPALEPEPRTQHERTPPLNMVALLTLLLTTVVVGFYIVGVNERNRNYGGWSNGLRWLLWLTPFWLLTMLPVADWLAGRRWGRGLAYLLLGISVLSASYRAWNPWRHPWLYEFFQTQGWINY
jgi:hypothetical protein